MPRRTSRSSFAGALRWPESNSGNDEPQPTREIYACSLRLRSPRGPDPIAQKAASVRDDRAKPPPRGSFGIRLPRKGAQRALVTVRSGSDPQSPKSLLRTTPRLQRFLHMDSVCLLPLTPWEAAGLEPPRAERFARPAVANARNGMSTSIKSIAERKPCS